MNDVEREYEYKPKWTLILFSGVFFGLGTVVLGAKATANERGLILNGIIELGVDNATVFYWVLTALSCGFVLAAVFLAYHRVAIRQRLMFGPVSMTVPASRWSRDVKHIAYRAIRELSATAINGQRFLYVTHSGGNYIINAGMLASKAVFEEVCEMLATKVREVRTTEQRLT